MGDIIGLLRHSVPGGSSWVGRKPTGFVGQFGFVVCLQVQKGENISEKTNKQV